MTAHSSATNRTTSQEIYIQISKVGNVAIAGAHRTPLKVTELVEQEQRMLAGAAEVTIVSRSLLFFMGRTDAAVQVENDHFGGRRS